MDLSVILCTWNGSDLLRDTLEHLAKCRIPEGLKWELVLVDNNSTEDIKAIAEEFKDHLPIQYVLEKQQGLSHARNAGIEAASGTLLIFTDNDVRPSEEWIAAYWKAFQEHPEGWYFGGSIRPRFEEGVCLPDALLAVSPRSVQGFDYGPDGPETKNHAFCSANWACLSVAIRKIGSFNPEFGISGNSQKTGEEDEIQGRLRQNGYRPWVVADSWIWHYVPKQIANYKHIVTRLRANGYFSVMSSNTVSLKHSLAGVPLWKLRHYLSKKLCYYFYRIIGRTDYSLMSQCCFLRGQIDAFYDLRKLSRNKKA